VEPTLAEWWSLDDGSREVVVDQLLERVPPGYIDPRSTGHEARALPQFVHEATGVLFHVVFGGPAVIGMSPRRFERLRQISADDDEDLMVPVARLEEAEDLTPARPVRIRTALVASETLSFGVLRKLGLDESRLTISAFSPVVVGSLLKPMTPLRWRAPSEAEWEYACRAVEDEVTDEPPAKPTGRLLSCGLGRMGHQVELCRDDWRDDLSELPEVGSLGQGHEVLRGRGSGARFAGWNVSAAWNEALWPGRRRLATWTSAVAIRPWVELLAL
jgi:hypothetical protein